MSRQFRAGISKVLPPVVHPFPNKAVAVRMRKVRGNIYQDYDVYVGYRIDNPSWRLPESKWHNPFEEEELPLRLALYKKHILETADLRDAMPNELFGRRLGCLCDGVGQGSCHADVLADLVNASIKVQDVVTEDAVFFKGSQSPFSNLFPCRLQYDNETFLCLEQVRAYQMAQTLSEPDLKAQIIRCEKVSQVCHLCPLVKKKHRERVGNTDFVKEDMNEIVDMFKLLTMKYKQSTDFRHSCVKLVYAGEKIPVEATSSQFWGIGQDISSLPPNPKLKDIQTGFNMLGWLILFVVTNSVDVLATEDEMSPLCINRTIRLVKERFLTSGFEPPITGGLQLLLSTMKKHVNRMLDEDLGELAAKARQEPDAGVPQDGDEEEERRLRSTSSSSMKKKKQSRRQKPFLLSSDSEDSDKHELWTPASERRVVTRSGSANKQKKASSSRKRRFIEPPPPPVQRPKRGRRKEEPTMRAPPPPSEEKLNRTPPSASPPSSSPELLPPPPARQSQRLL